jgi:hypothetical protein
MAQPTVRIFISHSHRDQALATKLEDLLVVALRLPHEAIRCTSVGGSKLPGGASVSSTLVDEIDGCFVVLGILSPDSLDSQYVAFEYGVARHAKKPFIPLRAPGFPANAVKAPVSEIASLDIASREDLHSLLDQVSGEIFCDRASPAAYSRHIDALVAWPKSSLAEATEPHVTTLAAPSVTQRERASSALSLTAHDEDLLMRYIERENRGRRWFTTTDVANLMKWELSYAQHRLDVLKKSLILRISHAGYGLTEKGRAVAIEVRATRAAAGEPQG